MTWYPKRVMMVAELEVGDVVTPGYGEPRVDPWDASIVKAVNPERSMVTLWRPYGTTTDWNMGTSVICYLGLEEHPIERSAQHLRYFVWQRMGENPDPQARRR